MQLASRDSSALRRGRLLVLLALITIAGVFAFGARSWVQFYEHNGGPVGLFTQTDFPGVLIGAGLISAGSGAELYDLDAQLRQQQVLTAQGYLILSPEENGHLKYPYPYPPFLALLWSPLAGISPLMSMALYDLLNIVAMALGLCMLLWSLAVPSIARWLLLLAGLTSLPFIINLEQGQSSGIVLFSFAAGIALLKRGRDLPAGLALGLLVLKVQWLPLLVLVLLWKRRWKAMLGMSCTALALVAITLAAIGIGWIPDYLAILQMAQRFAPELLLDPSYSHSLTGQLAFILPTDAIRADILVATIAAAGVLLGIWRGEWRPGSARWDGAMGLTVLAILFTNLQLNTHDLSLLVMPAALGLSYMYQLAERANVRMLWQALLWASYLICLPPTMFSQPLKLTTLMIALLLGFLTLMLMRERLAVRNPTVSLNSSNPLSPQPSALSTD